MKSNEDGVSVTVATRTATSQGRHMPRRDQDSEVKAEARQLANEMPRQLA